MASHRIAFIHSGTVKTGSSYLQAQFAACRDKLMGLDITYPISDSLANKVLAGLDTAGNGQELIKATTGYGDAGLAQILKGISTSHCLLSSEILYAALASPSNLERFVGAFDNAGFSEIKLLVFVRNILDHSISWYLQKLKTQAGLPSLETFLSLYAEPRKVARFLRLIYTLSDDFRMDIKVACKNYDHEKDHLFASVAQWLDLDIEPVSAASLEERNLSLSELEAYCCMALSSTGISPSLFVKRVSELQLSAGMPPYRPAFSLETMVKAYAHNQESIEYINRHLEEQTHLPLDVANIEPREACNRQPSSQSTCGILRIFAETYSNSTTRP
jgi:hypothetical protein